MQDNQVLSIVLNLFIVAGTLILMTLSEGFNKEVKYKYRAEFGQDSWSGVLTSSIAMGAIVGTISVFVSTFYASGYLAPYLANYGTIVGYVGMQSVFTDTSLKLVNRHMLRIGYIDVFFLSLAFLMITYPSWEVFKLFALPVLLLYLVLIAMFFVSNIGASDMRAFMIVIPFLQAVNMALSLILLAIVTVLIFIYMTIEKKRRNDPYFAVPILPYIVVPYMFIAPFIEPLLEWWRIRSAM